MKIHVEVFIASRILGQNQETFTPSDIREFIEREFHDTQHGIQTHITSRCVANAPLNFEAGCNYLWRVSRGVYRLFRSGIDQPFAGREKDPSEPNRVEIPEKYHYLLNQTKQGFPQKSSNASSSQPRDIGREKEITSGYPKEKTTNEKKSFRSSASFGKRQEYIAVAELLRRGHDVYMTLVDDQQIDCVIRQEKNGQLRYLDIQIKARSFDAKNPGLFAAMEVRSPRENFYYIFYSESANMYWIIPSLELIEEAHQNKEGKNKGKYSITFANAGSKKTNPRPRFAKYENAFELLKWND